MCRVAQEKDNDYEELLALSHDATHASELAQVRGEARAPPGKCLRGEDTFRTECPRGAACACVSCDCPDMSTICEFMVSGRAASSFSSHRAGESE